MRYMDLLQGSTNTNVPVEHRYTVDSRKAALLVAQDRARTNWRPNPDISAVRRSNKGVL